MGPGRRSAADRAQRRGGGHVRDGGRRRAAAARSPRRGGRRDAGAPARPSRPHRPALPGRCRRRRRAVGRGDRQQGIGRRPARDSHPRSSGARSCPCRRDGPDSGRSPYRRRPGHSLAHRPDGRQPGRGPSFRDRRDAAAGLRQLDAADGRARAGAGRGRLRRRCARQPVLVLRGGVAAADGRDGRGHRHLANLQPARRRQPARAPPGVDLRSVRPGVVRRRRHPVRRRGAPDPAQPRSRPRGQRTHQPDPGQRRRGPDHGRGRPLPGHRGDDRPRHPPRCAPGSTSSSIACSRR